VVHGQAQREAAALEPSHLSSTNGSTDHGNYSTS
jgi:hypothetical protein